MKVHLSLDTNADVYEMNDAWEESAKGTIVEVPEWVWIRYQEAQEVYDFWQSYVAERLYE